MKTEADLKKMSDDEYVHYLESRVRDLEDALKPFSHPDLSKYLVGQDRNDSEVYGRDKAILRISDFRRAKELLD